MLLVSILQHLNNRIHFLFWGDFDETNLNDLIIDDCPKGTMLSQFAVLCDLKTTVVVQFVWEA